MQKYVGVKRVDAWRETRDGKSGYGIQYPDGYKSWSPKEAFEAAYQPVNVFGTMPPEYAKSMIADVSFTKMGEKTTVCLLKLHSGFEVIGTSSPTRADDYRQDIGEDRAYARALEQVVEHLAFVCAWANNGLTQ